MNCLFGHVQHIKITCIVKICYHKHDKIELFIQYYTIMDFLLSKYGLIFTEFDRLRLGQYFQIQ